MLLSLSTSCITVKVSSLPTLTQFQKPGKDQTTSCSFPYPIYEVYDIHCLLLKQFPRSFGRGPNRTIFIWLFVPIFRGSKVCFLSLTAVQALYSYTRYCTINGSQFIGEMQLLEVVTSASFLAEVSISAPRKLFIFIIKNIFFLDLSIQKHI